MNLPPDSRGATKEERSEGNFSVPRSKTWGWETIHFPRSQINSVWGERFFLRRLLPSPLKIGVVKKNWKNRIRLFPPPLKMMGTFFSLPTLKTLWRPCQTISWVAERESQTIWIKNLNVKTSEAFPWLFYLKKFNLIYLIYLLCVLSVLSEGR